MRSKWNVPVRRPRSMMPLFWKCPRTMKSIHPWTQGILNALVIEDIEPELDQEFIEAMVAHAGRCCLFWTLLVA